MFVNILVIIPAFPKFHSNIPFLLLTDLGDGLAPSLNIIWCADVDRALFLGRSMPEVHNKSQEDNRERREVEPVWCKVEEEESEE